MSARRPTSNSRRRFLRGACSAVLALPMLEWFAPSKPAGAAATPPRFLVYYMPNGRVPEWWVPSMAPGSLTFSAQSADLQPFANRCLSMVNLDNIAARNSPGAAHAMGTGTIMTGSTIPDLIGLKNNISLDQVIANELAPPTRFKSLQWSAGEPGPCDVGGASCAYTQSVSWAGPSSPLIPTIDPKAAFDRLFASATDGLAGPAGETRKRSLASVLDHVDEDAKALQSRLGQGDKVRLEEYFTALRELEKSLTSAAITCDIPEDIGPGGPLPYDERVKKFHDLIALAFQCDQTRVMSFMIEFGLSGRSHEFLEAPGQHHALSHYGGDAGVKARLEKVESWHSKMIGDLLTKLSTATTPEGSSLLDETVVLCIASMGWGDPHDHGNNSPLIFGGGGIINCNGGQIIPGPGTPLSNLHATLLAGYGITGTFGTNGAIFGDHGTGTIPGVLL